MDHTIGPNEQKAIRLLAAAQAMPHLSAQEKADLLAAQHAVRLAKFQDLPRKLNALQKAVAKKPVSTAVYLDKLFEIVRSYPLDVAEEAEPESNTPATAPSIPEIILSESFVPQAT